MTPWTVARWAPLSIGFSKQEYWSGLPCHPSGDLPDPEIEPAAPITSALAGGFVTTSNTWKAHPASVKPNIALYIFTFFFLLQKLIAM